MLEQQPVSDIRLSTRHGNHAIETEVEDAAFDFRHGTPGADEELVAVGLGLFAHADSGRLRYDVVFVGQGAVDIDEYEFAVGHVAFHIPHIF